MLSHGQNFEVGVLLTIIKLNYQITVEMFSLSSGRHGYDMGGTFLLNCMQSCCILLVLLYMISPAIYH